MKDLYLLVDKVCELQHHMGGTAEAEELRQTNHRVLNVFKQLYWQVGVRGELCGGGGGKM